MLTNYVIHEWSLSSKSEISLTNWPGRSFYRHVTLKVDVKPTWNYPQFFCHMFYLNLTFWEFKLDSFTATFTHFQRSLNVWMLSGHLWPWTLFSFLSFSWFIECKTSQHDLRIVHTSSWKHKKCFHNSTWKKYSIGKQWHR